MDITIYDMKTDKVIRIKSNNIPRIGDSINLDYVPCPKVIEVIWSKNLDEVLIYVT